MRRKCIFKSQYGRRGGSTVFSYEKVESSEEDYDEIAMVNVYQSNGTLLGEVPITEIEPVTNSMLDYSYGGEGRFVAHVESVREEEEHVYY